MTQPSPRTYRSQVSVEPVGSHQFIVRAVPYPIHTAEVTARLYQGRPLCWRVTMLTGDLRTQGELSLRRALSLAGEWVGLATGADMKARFQGAQRSAMGQQQCPYLGPVDGGVGLCLGPPMPGSVWCARHPEGRKVRRE